MANRGSPAILISRTPSNWASCRVITPNLEAAYRIALGPGARFHSYNSKANAMDAWQLSGEIFRQRPDRIVFIDHLPHPNKLIDALDHRYGGNPLPPIYIHVYGDFTLQASEWIQIEEVLRRTRLHFFCASHRQMGLISRFLNQPNGVIARCPFPVDTRIFSYDPRIRKEWRKKLGISSKETAIVYTGRISMQKNVALLTQEILSFSKMTGSPIRFFLAGSFDDIGSPFFGVRPLPGSYYQHWQEVQKEFPKEIREQVSFLGHLDRGALKGLYHAADFYSSLSLHHDEDYGMSPAEALCCGTPVLLSDWGGYASFKHEAEERFEDAVRLVPVEIGADGLRIDSAVVQRNLSHLISRSGPKPESTSRHFKKRLSIATSSELIRDAHLRLPPKFAGFSGTLRQYAERLTRPVPFSFSRNPRRNTFYKAVYGAYTNSDA